MFWSCQKRIFVWSSLLCSLLKFLYYFLYKECASRLIFGAASVIRQSALFFEHITTDSSRKSRERTSFEVRSYYNLPLGFCCPWEVFVLVRTIFYPHSRGNVPPVGLLSPYRSKRPLSRKYSKEWVIGFLKLIFLIVGMKLTSDWRIEGFSVVFDEPPCWEAVAANQRLWLRKVQLLLELTTLVDWSP